MIQIEAVEKNLRSNAQGKGAGKIDAMLVKEEKKQIDSASDKPRRAVHPMLTYDKIRLAIRASCHFASMRADTCIP